MIAFAFYLLKVMICSGVLFLYYHLALRNKLFHQWNRFYLLAAIVISLVAPIVQVTIMHRADEPAKAIQMLQVFESAGGYLEEVTINGRPSISTDQWLMMGYIIVSCVFLITVLLSFQKIVSILKSHTIQWVEKIKFVNTKVQGTPFSFFNFIFWNEDIDLQTETGQQIFEHELVHVKEKHTVDKLFVQFVLIVFWCNPFFWLVRRELKLIHEFIADKKAVGEHGTAALAAMILSSSYPTRFNSLTNQFFQTSIKRRIAMLAKIQNPRINYLSRILVLSISILTILAFTLRTKTVAVPTVKLDKAITVIIDAGHGMMANGKYNGAVVENIAEDDIVLTIAKKIKELNKNDQIKIVLTRSTQQVVDLHRRVEIAKENNADLFLSIHVNAYMSNANTGDRSKQEQLNGFGVYVSNKQTAFQQQSEILGTVLTQELNSIYPVNPFLLKRQVGVWVLDQNVCPSVMVECGFLTDKKDREFITKENNQKEVALKILEAIGRYALNQQKAQDSRLDTVPQKQVTVTGVILKDPNASKQDSGRNSNFFKLDVPNPPLYILDGKEITRKELEKLDPNIIESVTVWKNQTAIEKYGQKGTNGVVEMISKNKIEIKEIVLPPPVDTVPQKNNQNKVKEIFIDGQKLRSDEVRFSKISWQQAKNSKQLIVVNDKLVHSIDDLNPSDVVSVSIGQGLPLVKEYGDKAATGVIFIVTKNYKRTGSEPIFTKVEVEASVNQKEWISHLQKNLLSVIESATSKGISLGTYTVQVKFLVLKDGTVTDVKALNDPGYGLADGAVKVLENGPKWNPGLQNGRPVNSYHTQPITFVIIHDPVTKLPEIKINDLMKMDRLDIQNVVSFYIAFERADGDLVTYSNPSRYFDKTAKSL